MILPTTREEIVKRGWERPDIILVSGDAYIDSPYIGVAVIGRVLEDAGFRVAIIGQPDTEKDTDITRLGEPRFFWGVSGGSIDSLVANRTAGGKFRKKDDYTPGGFNSKRPDRAVIVYSNLIRRYFKNTVSIVLGGIEASLRRVAHYDYWSNSIRRSILFDAKADYLLYGMAEKSVVELAHCFQKKREPYNIKGLCYIGSHVPDEYIGLPSFDQVREDKQRFTKMFSLFYENNDPLTAKGLAQSHGKRYLIQNPPADLLSTQELDTVHELDFTLDLHPFHQKEGSVRALETIRFGITSHRGCYGECNFCAIAVHQGRTVQWRSKESLMRETKKLTQHASFTGVIHDVGGPTANMYGFECPKKLTQGVCKKKRCLFPKICPSLPIDHNPQISLLKSLRKIPGIQQVRVASGLRYDMILADEKNGQRYLREIICHHIGGQLKIAPEHSEKNVLNAMGKPGSDKLLTFRDLFVALIQKEKKKNLFLTYYMIAAHPGCTMQNMHRLKDFCRKELRLLPRQVQIFTPTPSTWSSLMYWTGIDPQTGKQLFVERNKMTREKQKSVLTGNASPKKGKTNKRRSRK